MVESVTLSEICPHIKNGANIKQGTDDRGYPITRIETIYNGKINRDRMGYGGILDIENYLSYVMQDGDILMSHINSISHLGKTAIYMKSDPHETIIHGMNLLLLRCDTTKVLSKYLYYYFNSKIFRMKLQNIVKPAVNQASFSISDLRNISINIHDITNQKLIIKVLDTITSIIEKRKQQIALLEDAEKSLFVEMFGDSVTNPMGWDTVKLDEIATVGSSKRVFVGELKEEGIPFYRGTEIGMLADSISFTPKLYIKNDHYDKLCKESGKPEMGDLLLPSICPDGRIWMVNSDSPFYFKDGRVLWIHSIKESINTLYLKYALKEKFLSDYHRIASGTTFAEMKIFTLKSLSIMNPPLKLQNHFSTQINHLEQQKALLKSILSHMEELKSALKQDYFG